ncbi:hypothetical protein [Sphingomonas profundi]|uniref:hypothetical protein n=1 Tax=Alterirhizorhabdus profundi TaxID=2681549 RepID=UPI0012E8CA1F|nr:hypothetical protein [Sphingomonas profundi]
MTLFLAWRPALLLVLAIAMARWRPPLRIAGYAAALLLASGSAALLVVSLGGGRIAGDAARAILAGALMAALFDLALVAARLAEPRAPRLLGAAIGIGLLLVPGPRRLFERIALPPPPPPVAGARPTVTLLSGLPLLWADDGPPAARPNATMRRLAAEFRLRPIDAATPAALTAAPLLLAAQPRELGADEIEALDGWVRMGGGAVLLVDADLRWPGGPPPGDARRPPRWATLAPLLAGWDVTLSRGARGIATVDLPGTGGVRRIVTDAAGRLRVGPGCRLLAEGRAADCRIGRGRALILADADMMDDRLWVGVGEAGDDRLHRGGDNAMLLAEWLDRLAANPRDRAGESVFWRRVGTPVTAWVCVGALLPALLIGLIAACDIRRIRHFGSSDRHKLIHRNKKGRTAEKSHVREQPPPG